MSRRNLYGETDRSLVTRRTLLLAASIQDGEEWLRANPPDGGERVWIASTTRAGRGLAVQRIVETRQFRERDDIKGEIKRYQILQAALPCAAASPGAQVDVTPLDPAVLAIVEDEIRRRAKAQRARFEAMREMEEAELSAGSRTV